MKPITPLNYKTFQFISAYITQFGYAPSLEEIAWAMDVARSVIGKRLDALQRAGWITRERYKVRAIKIASVTKARAAA